MKAFAVEVYASRSSAPALAETAARARAAAEALAAEGTQIRYVRSLFLPEDETCFHVFEAPSVTAVERIGARAGFRHARILEAIQ